MHNNPTAYLPMERHKFGQPIWLDIDEIQMITSFVWMMQMIAVTGTRTRVQGDSTHRDTHKLT